MGKFAGFLKRAKKIAGIGMNVLNSFNDIYKGIKTTYIKSTILGHPISRARFCREFLKS